MRSSTLLALSIHAVLLIAPLAAHADAQLLPPVENDGTEKTVCASGHGNKVLTWDGQSALKCINGFTIDSNGNIGIGTTSPSQKIDAKGSISASAGYFFTTDGSNGLLQAQNGNLYLRAAGGGNRVVFDSGDIQAGNGGPGAIHIFGSTLYDSGDYLHLGAGKVTVDGDTLVVGNGGPGYLHLWGSNIYDNGDYLHLGAGKTTTDGDLQVNGGTKLRGDTYVATSIAVGAGTSFNCYGMGPSCNPVYGGVWGGLGYGTKNAGMMGNYSGNRFNIQWSGNVATLWIDNTNVATLSGSSDYRLKHEVKPLEVSGLERIMRLKPVTYRWKDGVSDFKDDGRDHEGFLAHEMQEVIPAAIEGKKDGVLKDGKPSYQAIDALQVLPTMVKAMQELKTDNDKLRQEVNELRQEIKTRAK